MFTWLPIPGLPTPPQEFVDRSIHLAHQDVPNTAINQLDPKLLKRQVVKDGKVSNSRIQRGYELGADWDQWVRDNIMETFVSTGGRYSDGDNTTIHGAHVDSRYNNVPVYKLYYLVDRGGDDATTYFFQQKGHPVEREGHPTNITLCDDYSQLEIIDQIQFPLNQWVLLNTNILHGVENVTGSRINLVVIFASTDIEQDIAKLNNNGVR
jgi:hypothetical protein